MRLNKVFTRTIPWQGIGSEVSAAPTSAEAIKLAGLDWEVIQKPIYCDDIQAPGMLGNLRVWTDSETQEIQKHLLGVVSPSYKPIQNIEAFDFFDSLIGKEAHYDTAGCLQEGKRIFLAAKMERDWKVADDDIDTYLLLTNGHDGRHALRAAVTPVRVVCLNTLNLALKTAKQNWSIFHTGDIKTKVKEAQIALGLTVAYMDEFVEFGNRAVDTKVSTATIEKMVEKILYPRNAKSDKTRERISNRFEECYSKPDIKQYQGTLWGVINAISDYETHTVKQASAMRNIMNNRLHLNSALNFLAQTV